MRIADILRSKGNSVATVAPVGHPRRTDRRAGPAQRRSAPGRRRRRAAGRHRLRAGRRAAAARARPGRARRVHRRLHDLHRDHLLARRQGRRPRPGDDRPAASATSRSWSTARWPASSASATWSRPGSTCSSRSANSSSTTSPADRVSPGPPAFVIRTPPPGRPSGRCRLPRRWRGRRVSRGSTVLAKNRATADLALVEGLVLRAGRGVERGRARPRPGAAGASRRAGRPARAAAARCAGRPCTRSPARRPTRRRSG